MNESENLQHEPTDKSSELGKAPFGMKRLPSRGLYTLISLTWGLPLTLFGAIIASALLISGKRPKRFGYCLYFEVGEKWGGLEGGLFFITCKNPPRRLLCHEHGHGLQNLFFGPLMLPLVTIPSAIRWNYRHHLERRGIALRRSYGAIWFERQADELGTLCAAQKTV